MFTRIITRHREIYLLKIISLAVAFASSVLVILFSLHEFGYDRFHKDSSAMFRILQHNSGESHMGNRLSAKIPADLVSRLSAADDSVVICRVKIMKEVTITSEGKPFRHQKIHAVDGSINEIFSIDIIDGDIQKFTSKDVTVLLSAAASVRYTGNAHSAGKKLKLYTFNDTIEATIAATFKDFPTNSHEDFEIFIPFVPSAISALSFNPNETGVYGRALKASLPYYETIINQNREQADISYRLQSLPHIYFGPRVLGEEARHGDSYSVMILICIAGLILFLALTSFVNLTTLTLPYRAKEIAVKKLAGISQSDLVLSFLKESLLVTGIAIAFSFLLLLFTSTYIEKIIGLSIPTLIREGGYSFFFSVAGMFLLLSISPVAMTFKFTRATPNRLLSADAISFPKFKRVIAFLQLGISIFLIVASLVVRRQINYSLLKEPGRNHDQVVYLNSPSGITNEGIVALRTNWKKYNPNILDVMAVSQLPDRLSSKEIGSGFYSLKVDQGFLEFFNLNIEEGNWFKVNTGDSLIITNHRGKIAMGKNQANMIGVIEDLSGKFNQPERPVKIMLGQDFGYNWLCVRVLEVDIRRTVSRLSHQFSLGDKPVDVRFLDRGFQSWIDYQDRLNILSGILAIVSALLSCCAIYGLTVSLVRDKLKQIAVHKLLGAQTTHITRLLLRDFAKQLLLAVLVFGPLTYIFLHELLRTFVYSTKLSWLDPLYPIAYCGFIITLLCGFQAFNLNRSDLTSALKG